MDLTFLICSHRAGPGLEATLASLAVTHRAMAATGAHPPDWEALVVNNGFSAATQKALTQWAAQHHAELAQRLRFAIEPTPGLGFARKRGYQEAKGQWLVLLDDDNTVAPDFLERMWAALQTAPTGGGLVASVLPLWVDGRPADWVVEISRWCLSINDYWLDTIRPLPRWFPPGKTADCPRPPGGGMIVHRDAATAYLAEIPSPARLALARTGESLVGCEDHDLWRHVIRLDRGVYATDQPRLFHHLGASRTRLGYLTRLLWAMSWSYGRLEKLQDGPLPAKGKLRQVMLSTRMSLKYLQSLVADAGRRNRHWPVPWLLACREWGWIFGRCR